MNETPIGEETFRTLRRVARSFEPEPEPVAVTVIGTVIVGDERKMHETLVDDAPIGKGLGHLFRIVAMKTSMIESTSTKIVEIRQR